MATVVSRSFMVVLRPGLGRLMLKKSSYAVSFPCQNCCKGTRQVPLLNFRFENTFVWWCSVFMSRRSWIRYTTNFRSKFPSMNSTPFTRTSKKAPKKTKNGPSPNKPVSQNQPMNFNFSKTRTYKNQQDNNNSKIY